MKKFAMVIDLHKCVGCGACDLACKSENNTPEGIEWATHVIETHGEFPNVRYEHVPTLCNHCENPQCVRVCPTQAMHIDKETGMVLHNSDICIGCKSCIQADPYHVIHFNKKQAHREWKTKEKSLIADCTSTMSEIARDTQSPFPYYNNDRESTYEGIRPKGTVEKCTFCDHRVRKGELPYCVISCPADARIFGDLNDPKSEVVRLLKKYKIQVLKPHKGTRPKVYYIREFNNAL